MRQRTRAWPTCLLAGLLLSATPSLGQEPAPSIDREEVKRLISKGFAELGAERYEEARQLLESAWKASDSQSAEAALGLAEAYALLRQPKAAEEHARIAVELADHPWTKAAALLVSGAAAYQVLLDYEAEGPGEGEEQTPQDLMVRLAAAITFLEQGLELSDGDPTGARVLLAEAYLRGRLAKKARIVLDQYFDSGDAPQMREQAENLRCLAGGTQADFQSPPPANEMQKPVKISAPYPRYTEEARKKGWQGQALVQAVVDDQGAVPCARMYKQAPYGLSESALDAVRQWKYQPALHNGKPIKAMLYLAIDFKLEEVEE